MVDPGRGPGPRLLLMLQGNKDLCSGIQDTARAIRKVIGAKGYELDSVVLDRAGILGGRSDSDSVPLSRRGAAP